MNPAYPSGERWGQTLLIPVHSRDCQLVVLGVGEPYKGQMVSSESLGRGKGLVDCVVFNVVKVPSVVIAGELCYHRRHAVTNRLEVPGVVGEKLVVLHLIHTTVTKTRPSARKTILG